MIHVNFGHMREVYHIPLFAFRDNHVEIGCTHTKI